MNTRERSFLKSRANTIKPLVSVGKDGLSENIINEINISLYHNELIKVSVLKNNNIEPKEMANEIAEKTGSEVVQVLGSKITLYKFSEKENIKHIFDDLK